MCLPSLFTYYYHKSFFDREFLPQKTGVFRNQNGSPQANQLAEGNNYF